MPVQNRREATMRIEEIKLSKLKEVSNRELYNLRLRFVQLWTKNFHNNNSQQVGELKRTDMMKKYRALAGEMKSRGLSYLKETSIDRAVFKKAMLGVDVPSLGDHLVAENYVSICGPFVKGPKDSSGIDIVIRDVTDNRNVELEKRVVKLVEKETEKEAKITYDPEGPQSAFIPVFDLILRTRDETKKIDLEKKGARIKIEKPEVTDTQVRVPVRSEGCEVTATITISEEKGIKALYCGKEKAIQTYLFDKDKWTMAQAKKWIKENGEAAAKSAGDKASADGAHTKTPTKKDAADGSKDKKSGDKEAVDFYVKVLEKRPLKSGKFSYTVGYAADGETRPIFKAFSTSLEADVGATLEVSAKEVVAKIKDGKLKVSVAGPIVKKESDECVDTAREIVGRAHSAGILKVTAYLIEELKEIGVLDESKHKETRKKLSEAQRKECDAETEKIRENQKTAKYPHKFKPAKYTHPNGHPRCIICGQEELIDSDCQPPEKPYFKFSKVNKKEQIVGGIVYAPSQKDAQGDFTDRKEIERAMYKFMEKYAEDPKRIKVMHKGESVTFPILESFIPEQDIIKGDDIIKSGAWWLMIRITDPEIWAAVESGQLNGFSMGGTARA
jgi:hypothetical protein